MLPVGTAGTVVAAATVALSAVLALAGCGLDVDHRTHDVPRTEAPGELVRIDCPPDGTGIDGLHPEGGRPETGAPSGFTASTAVFCRPEMPASDRHKITIAVEHAPVTPDLTRALLLPDRQFVDPEGGVCAASYTVKPYLLLVDDRGRGYRPVLPRDECDNLRDKVSSALDGLQRTTVRRYQVKINR